MSGSKRLLVNIIKTDKGSVNLSGSGKHIVRVIFCNMIIVMPHILITLSLKHNK